MTCPCDLSFVPDGYPPTSYAIDDLVQGRDGALGRTIMLTIGRAAFIAPGLWLAGQRQRLLKTSLYVSATITIGMIGVKLLERR